MKYFYIFSFPTFSDEIIRRVCLYGVESHAFKSLENGEHLEKIKFLTCLINSFGHIPGYGSTLWVNIKSQWIILFIFFNWKINAFIWDNYILDIGTHYS